MKLLTIISNSGGRLIVVQQPQAESYTFWIILVVVLAACFIYRRAWQLLFIPALLAVVIYSSSFIGQKTTYRAEIDQETRQITSEQLEKDKIVSKTTIPASDLNSAEMQFNRGASRIVLVHRDGRQEFPLGEQHLQNEPDQYVVLNALRQAIGQVPVAPR